MKYVKLFAVSVISAVLFVPNAKAQEAGQLRLQIDAEALAFTQFNSTSEDVIGGIKTENITKNSTFSAGFASNKELTEAIFVPTSKFAVGLGFTATPVLTIGARLGLGIGITSPKYEMEGTSIDPDTSIRMFSWAFLPYLEAAFSNGPLRPFVGVTVGIQGARVTFDDSENSTGAFLFMAGASGGLRIFPADRVSIDLSLLATLGFGKSIFRSESTFEDLVWDEDSTTSEDETKLFRFNVGFLTGLSVWL